MNLLFCFVLDSVIVSVSTISININLIPVLTGTDFKNWKENVMIVLGCMDFDLALREEWPTSLSDKNLK